MPKAVDNEILDISEEATTQSQPFVGQWNQLISTTNWEKGDIIVNWRETLKDENAKPTEYSDEAWSQLVGGVTAQHVGRLRRTYDRFGHVYKEYENIYWSHFYAALEWDDAEMWLEGAVQKKWSVSKMRRQRWETLGKNPEDEPTDAIVASELNEEMQSLDLAEAKRQNDRDYVSGPVHEGPDFGDEDPKGSKKRKSDDEDDDDTDEPEEKLPTIRPFESFKDLPDDVVEASSNFKLAIIRHKSEEWSEMPEADMLGLLDALKQLVTAPSK